MAEDVQVSKLGALGDGGQTGEQQASNQAALPEAVEVEPQKPERGLTISRRHKRRNFFRHMCRITFLVVQQVLV